MLSKKALKSKFPTVLSALLSQNFWNWPESLVPVLNRKKWYIPKLATSLHTGLEFESSKF